MESSAEKFKIDELIQNRLDEILPQRIEQALVAREQARTLSMTLIATKGTLDWAYPPFILAVGSQLI